MRQGPQEEARFSTSPDRSSELAAVNRQVNRDMELASDIEVIGQLEYCTIPRSATAQTIGSSSASC
jgi:predicted transglutaminase-like cysteine proteinase